MEVLEARAVARRRAVLVVDDGGGRVQAAPAAHLRPPGEVRVVEAEEERLVEATDVVEHRPPQQRRPAAGAEDLDRLRLAGLDRLAEQAIEGDPEAVDPDAGRVDDPGALAREAHLGGHRADVRGRAPHGEQLPRRRPASVTTSVLTSRTHSPPERRIPSATPAAKPTFDGISTTVASGASRAASSSEPSREALSTTIELGRRARCARAPRAARSGRRRGCPVGGS